MEVLSGEYNICKRIINNVRNIQKNIFQTFWKQDSCPYFLLFQLETLNFGVLMDSKKSNGGLISSLSKQVQTLFSLGKLKK